MRELIRRAASGGQRAFFLRAAQEAFIRSDTASFSLAVIGRRFLAGVASDAVSATGVAAAAGRRAEERRAAGFAGAEVPRILSTTTAKHPARAVRVRGNRLWLLSPAANAHPGLELYETFAYRDRRMDGAATISVTINEQDWQQTLFLYRQR